MDAIALTAGEHADLLLLVGTLEVERAAIGPGIDFALAEIEDFVSARDLLVQGLVGIQRVAALVDIAELDALADQILPSSG